MNLNTLYKKIDNQISSKEIKHIEIDPKTIKVSPKSGYFTALDAIDNTLHTFAFTEQGIGCIQWLMRGYKLEDFIKENLAYAVLTSRIRSFTNPKVELKKSEITLLQNKLLTHWKLLIDSCFQEDESLFLHISKDKVMGITRTYNDIITDEDILREINSAGLLSKVKRYFYTDKRFNIDLEINGSEKFVLRISNGHTGHETLSYKAIASIDKFNFELVEKGKARHLSNLIDVFSKIEDSLDDLRTKDIVKKLEKQEGISVIVQLQKFLSGRGGLDGDKFARGDWRLKLMTLTDAQVEKLEELLGKSKDKVNGTSLDGETAIKIVMEMANKAKGVKLATEVLVNSYLLGLFEGMS